MEAQFGTIRITDRWLRALKPSQNRLEFADSICPGLRIRIGKRAISWSVLVRIGTAPPPHRARVLPRNRTSRSSIGSRKGTLKDLLKLAIEEMEIEGKGATGQYRAYLLEGIDNAAAVMGTDRPACEITPVGVALCKILRSPQPALNPATKSARPWYEPPSPSRVAAGSATPNPD